jgi:mono/diheme cytochrome c family protein
MLLASVAALLAAAATAPSTTPSADGAALYQRCAACHLPSGAGVPGAYPPLDAHVRAFARSSEGRRYLALVVARGIAGTVTVAGKRFQGAMPAQAGLDDAGIAAVLNHVLGVVATGGPAPRSYTAEEVKAARASGSNLGPADVAALRGKLPAP